jgi:phosphoglycerate kinase
MSELSLSRYPGGERIKRLADLEVSGKRVFLRVDFNVPIKDGVITDDTRIRAALPTIEALCERGASVVCASHLGRPKGQRSHKNSLEPAAAQLSELTSRDIIFSEDCTGNGVVRQSKELKPGQILVLENLRFYEGEEKNQQEFAHELAKLCDVYVNDAFGTCHRAHASTEALPRLVNERGAGLLLEKEIAALAKLIHNPDRPLVAILGGSKVSDKTKVIDALMVKSSKILIGGAMAYTFLRALKIQTGTSRVESDLIALAGKLMERAEKAQCKIILPMDHVTGESFDNPGPAQTTNNTHIPEGRMGLDIGPRTRELFTQEIQGAQSIFWNGPMGVFEKPPFHEGTFAIAHAIATCSAKSKICGGGDSVAAINQSGVAEAFTHISTGGGASLEMIEGSPMPGIDSLKR